MQTSKLIAVFVTVLAVGAFAGASAQSGRRYVQPRTATSTAAPFSGAVLVGDTLYLSGALGLEANQQVPATVEAEATNVLGNIQKTLGEAGMTMDDLVFVQVFCADVANYDTFNKIYRGFFKQEFPARAFLGSGKLLFGARFEVQGIAVKRR
ncbi:MAG TPA: RidA family protein [Vicinamibacterales bacterium]|nr:RidA family protein [Vicinamibacterales bacterium]